MTAFFCCGSPEPFRPQKLLHQQEYKATIRNINEEDDANIPEEHIFIDAPTRVVVSDKDAIARAEVAEQSAPVRLRNYKIVKVTGSGHWIQLERRDEFSEILAKFADEL
ncbi:hypothetical protein NHQ30_007674 [Ciborinia camelliae]|nr:hypothetical protein NHQ30_007674 [Ciborinia camelliae]